jgi:hypothetical protein
VILTGGGDGTFQQASFPIDSGASSVAVADIDSDGKPDLVIAHSKRDMSYLLGNGDGTFQPETHFPGGASPSWTAIADFDGDGKPDLAVADSEQKGSVAILLNAPKVGWRTAESFHRVEKPRRLVRAPSHAFPQDRSRNAVPICRLQVSTKHSLARLQPRVLLIPAAKASAINARLSMAISEPLDFPRSKTSAGFTFTEAPPGRALSGVAHIRSKTPRSVARCQGAPLDFGCG